MSQNLIIEELESAQLKKSVPQFKVGDTVRVHMRIIEGNKERVQVFEGTVIAKKGSGLSESFSVYRHAYGSSMERVFLLHSPRIQKIEVMRSGRVRRAKLYYLRGEKGKRAKVRELITTKESVKAAKEKAEAKLKAAAKEEPKAEEPVEKKAEEPQAEKPAEKKAEPKKDSDK